mmetsp:Transcript_8450/g.25586  ORF Transcript_8450/g.25586 Transcript_8450/m.25586 type:complete len:264 (-) Transcript_8450:808-1599(-)
MRSGPTLELNTLQQPAAVCRRSTPHTIAAGKKVLVQNCPHHRCRQEAFGAEFPTPSLQALASRLSRPRGKQKGGDTHKVPQSLVRRTPAVPLPSPAVPLPSPVVPRPKRPIGQRHARRQDDTARPLHVVRRRRVALAVPRAELATVVELGRCGPLGELQPAVALGVRVCIGLEAHLVGAPREDVARKVLERARYGARHVRKALCCAVLHGRLLVADAPLDREAVKVGPVLDVGDQILLSEAAPKVLCPPLCGGGLLQALWVNV